LLHTLARILNTSCIPRSEKEECYVRKAMTIKIEENRNYRLNAQTILAENVLLFEFISSISECRITSVL
jgi:hypothetical protein